MKEKIVVIFFFGSLLFLWYEFLRDIDSDEYYGVADCNDWNQEIHPGAIEVCDDKDNNCDGAIDEGVKGMFYPDGDGDGYGTTSSSTWACWAPSGYVYVSDDCDDSDPDIHPQSPYEGKDCSVEWVHWSERDEVNGGRLPTPSSQ